MNFFKKINKSNSINWLIKDVFKETGCLTRNLNLMDRLKIMDKISSKLFELISNSG